MVQGLVLCPEEKSSPLVLPAPTACSSSVAGGLKVQTTSSAFTKEWLRSASALDPFSKLHKEKSCLFSHVTAEQQGSVRAKWLPDNSGFPLPPGESQAHAHCIIEGKLQNQRPTHDPGLSRRLYWTAHESSCKHVAGCRPSERAPASLGRAVLTAQ